MGGLAPRLAVALDWVGGNMREGQPLPYTVESQKDTAENKDMHKARADIE